MSSNDPSPNAPPDDLVGSATGEIRRILDEILASGRAQLEATIEMRAALADIRRRINASGPLMLPRPTRNLPQAPRRGRTP
jgi:hypothetical protein